MNTPRIKSVTAFREERLLVMFFNGIQKVYDCHWLLSLDRFQLLRNAPSSRQSELILVGMVYRGTMKWI